MRWAARLNARNDVRRPTVAFDQELVRVDMARPKLVSTTFWNHPTPGNSTFFQYIPMTNEPSGSHSPRVNSAIVKPNRCSKIRSLLALMLSADRGRQRWLRRLRRNDR